MVDRKARASKSRVVNRQGLPGAGRDVCMDTEERLAVADRAARAGGAVARATFREDLPVESKGEETDVVTQADRDAQRQVVATIRQAAPEDAIVGEEGDELKSVPEEGPCWVVDPIDGTHNYVRDLRVWATSVAAVVDGEAVAAVNALPALDDVYVADGDGTRRNGDPVAVSDRTDPETFSVAPMLWWPHDRREEYAVACREAVERFDDVRRFGSAQAVLSFVADGGLDAAFTNVRGDPWDTVAGVFMVEQAGGTVTDVHGDPWRHDSRGLVASNGEAHGEVLAAARAAEAVVDRED
jgi:myo-inositol-1(or 4)-monophosphatase